MRPVSVRIMHPEPGPDAGPLTRWLAAARAGLAERQRVAFLAAGATEATILNGRPDGSTFGERLQAMIRRDRPAGLVVLGSGSIPLATQVDRRDLVRVAASDDRRALANDRFSADVVAIARTDDPVWTEGRRRAGDVPRARDSLAGLRSDNALPRWLAESAGYDVTDLRRRWRLAVDLDSPLDLVLTGDRSWAEAPVDLAPVRARMTAIRERAADRNAEVVLSGRTSAATVGWIERHTASRTRAFIEERGLRTSRPGQRPPASVLGALLDRDGPEALGSMLAALGEAAVIDSRVLLAHRLGPDEDLWPRPEDRFASDLLLPGSVVDPWLRALTTAAAEAPIPVLLGGHSLVGPGLRLLLGTRPRARRR